MIALFLEMCVLVISILRDVRRDAQFRSLALLLALLLASGTMFYWQVEGWSIVDCLCFCVMTVATIGYGDVVPKKNVSKLFTIGYAILGIAVFASFVGRMLVLAWQRHKEQPKPSDPASK